MKEEIWGYSILTWSYNKEGEKEGVTIMADNGETQYLTIEEFEKFKINRKKL